MPRIREINPLFPDTSLEPKKPADRAAEILHETLDRAGQRSLEESTALLQERLAAIRRKKIAGEGRLSEAATIADIKRGKEQKISEGALTYVAVEDDAVIINASDAHGSFKDLSRAIAEFVQRRTAGENIYFNFSGDISSGDVDQLIPCMEALAQIQARFPDAVTMQFGNGDRRGTSLLMGMAREAAQRFAPELHAHLEAVTQEKSARFAEEQKITDPKKAKRGNQFLYGAELLRLARLAGIEPLNPHEFNATFLAGLTKGAVGVENSAILSKEVLHPLKAAIEPLRPGDKVRAQEYDPQLLEQARRIFEYWKLSDRVLNEQPALTVYESDGARVLATHSGYVGAGKKLGDLAYSPPKADQIVWSKIIHPDQGEKPGGVEKYGPDFVSFSPAEQGQMLDKIVPRDKPAVMVVGHNHGNFTERIPVGGHSVLRVENCVSSGKSRAGDKAAFVEIDMNKVANSVDDPESAVRFKAVA